MLHYLKQVKRFVKYLLTARTKYYIHSPFVYQLIEEVLYDDRMYYAFVDIQQLRKRLRQVKDEIEVQDLGAGSQRGNYRRRKIRDIAKCNAIGEKEGEVLFDLVNYFKPKQVLELGTSLGISTLYFSMANQETQITTIEGCPETAKYAAHNFRLLKQQNITLKIGDFDELLPKILPQLPSLDLVFLDGNHRKEATLNYFEQCLPFINNETILVLDDIHWSDGMEVAWQTIKAHPRVRITIDLFSLGLVFFRKEQEKEDFVLYF